MLFASFDCLARRSFQVAVDPGSCQTGWACRTRMSADHRMYAPRSDASGIRSVTSFPRIVPPSTEESYRGSRLGRQADRELGAAIGGVRRADAAAVRLGDRLGDRQPPARA